MKKHVLSRQEFLKEGLLSDEDATRIAKWNRPADEPRFKMTLTQDGNSINLIARDRQQAATVQLICAQNDIKFEKEPM